MISIASAGIVVAQDKGPAPAAAIAQRLHQPVPLDLAFRDDTGKDVTLKQFFDGKPVILALVYYRCPRLCSLVLNQLTESLRKLDYRIGKEFSVVTVSFDPREQPDLAAAKKAMYLELYGHPGAENGWHFLTGEEASIRRLADAVGFGYVYDPRRDQYAHASAVIVLTPDGKVARYHFGLDYPPRDLRFSLEDASAGKIGSPVATPLRMLCYAYDPATGRYGMAVMRLVQLGGVVTVVGIGAMFWRLRRRAGGSPARA